MKNFTSQQFLTIAFAVLSVIIFSFGNNHARAQAVYSTTFTDWSQSYNSNSGSYQGTGGPAIYSFGTTANLGQVNARLLTDNGTTGGVQQALRVGQKLIIRLTAPIGGGRSGIQTNGRIGFSLRNTTDLFDPSSPSSAFDRYNSNALLRIEYQGGQASAQIVDGGGTTLSGMPNFTDFVNGQTYEIEMISDKEYNLQVISGSRYNIRPLITTGTIKQMTIANLGENRDAVYSNVEVANTSTVSLVSNTAETWTVAGIISNNGPTANTITKTGSGMVILTGQNSFTGLTSVSNGTLKLNAPADNTINSGNNVTLSGSGILQVSQNQTLGNLTVPAGTSLIIDAGKTLTITGSFTGGGSITNNGTIVLAGTTSQSFPGNGTINAMNNLTINNNAASGVTINAASLTVTGTLNFIANAGLKALLTTGSNVITASTITGASETNGWVNGNLQKNIATSGLKTFETGDAANYTPVILNVSATSFTAGLIRVSTRTAISSALGIASLSLNTAQSINRVWSVTKPAGSTFSGSYAGTFNYVNSDLLGSPVVGTLKAALYNGSVWQYKGGITTGTLQVTTLAGFVPVATGDIVFAKATPVTISGVTVTTKIYDGGVSATLDFSAATVDAVLNGNFVAIYSGVAVGTFNNKHVGNGKAVTISGVGLMGTDPEAYVLIAQPTSTGNITERQLTITAATNTKNYDGNTSAAAIPAITSGVIQINDNAGFTETYDTKNAGTNKTLSPAGLVIDGNSGNNYAYIFVNNNTGIINNIPITDLSATPGSIACNGGTTSLTVSANGGDGALQYSLSGTASFPYQSSTVFTGVGAGIYTLTVKDEDNFTQQLSNIVVGQPGLLSGNYVKSNVSVCGNVSDGSITVTPSGGSGTYNYSWTGSNGFTAGNTSSLTGLPIGFYNVTITDANGCGVMNISNIHIAFAFSVYITNNGSITSSCGNTGSIILYGNAGVQPYTYALDMLPYQAGNSFTGLAAGDHTAYIKDAAGCISTKVINIASAAAITVSPFARGASSCAADGSIEIYRTGGIPPYTYSINGTNYFTSNVFTALASGPYTAYVKDSKDCIGTQSVTVTQGTALTVTANKTNTSTCTNDGTIQLNVGGGVAPYTYSKDNGSTYQSGNSFSGLAAGNYPMKVLDAKGCSGTLNVSINTNQIVVTAYAVASSNCLSSNGSIQLFRTGGVGPYTYSLDGNTYQSGNLFSGLAPGNYNGYVKDSKTCIGELSNIFVGPSCVRPGESGNMKAGIVKAETLNRFKLQAYPNPSTSEFTLINNSVQVEKQTITVTDLSGRKIFQAEGYSNISYRFGSELKAGVYILELITGTYKQSIKLIKE